MYAKHVLMCAYTDSGLTLITTIDIQNGDIIENNNDRGRTNLLSNGHLRLIIVPLESL